MRHQQIEELLQRIDAVAREKNLTRAELARLMGIPESTLRTWFARGHLRGGLSRTSIDRIQSFLLFHKASINGAPATLADIDRNAERKVEKIMSLLLLLESELRWFRDGTEQSRKTFRELLDPNDVGYISSLLIMLGDEAKFNRWMTLTTNTFNHFKRGRRNS